MTEKAKPDFVIDGPDTIEWPVEVTLPANGGATSTWEFVGIFKRMSEEEYDDVLGVPKAIDAATSAEPVEGVPVKRIAEVLAENAMQFPKFLVGWKRVRAGNGEEVPFSVERLHAAVTGRDGRYLSTGIWKAIHEVRLGARLGN